MLRVASLVVAVTSLAAILTISSCTSTSSDVPPADAGPDTSACCPMSPNPGCCMSYGGSPAAFSDGTQQCLGQCDGMPDPHSPAWHQRIDANGCPEWYFVESEVAADDTHCEGPTPPPDEDASFDASNDARSDASLDGDVGAD